MSTAKMKEALEFGFISFLLICKPYAGTNLFTLTTRTVLFFEGVLFHVVQAEFGACYVQVGRGLAFLHASGIVHGNLSSSTVLLRNSTLDRRGFVAKIGALLHWAAFAVSALVRMVAGLTGL